MDLKELFLKQKVAIRNRTRQVVEMIRPEHMAWAPAPGALSIGETLHHLWHSEENVRRVALAGDFSYYERRIPEGLRAVLGSTQALEAEKANLERVYTETLAAVEAFPLERFDDERIHDALGIRRKVYAILLGMNDHEIHHRAQLMTYLRILGTPVPEAIIRR